MEGRRVYLFTGRDEVPPEGEDYVMHECLFEFNGKSCVAHHDAELPGGHEHRRSMAVEEFSYRADGTIAFIHQTKAGPKANPSAACKRWSWRGPFCRPADA